MFSKTARYYDTIYAAKDYEGEVERLVSLLGVDARGRRATLLDVACGTGRHLEYLSRRFQVEGLDICAELLEVARERTPGVVYHLGDMTDFDLGKRFDVVTCLFSSIGYAKTSNKLRSALRCMASHLNPDGALVVEPWFTPESWQPHTVHALYIDEPELKIARVNTSLEKDGVSILDMHHLIGTPRETEHVLERHELGLFTVEETMAAITEAGLLVSHDPQGLTGRGLYIGRRGP